MAPTGNSPLLGRRDECELLDHLVSSLRAGQSRSLVIRADAGMGKSALLDYLAANAPGCRVLRAVGAESERELAYAGLHQLCAPLLDGLADLAPPQAMALGVALGLRSGDAPDRFLVGLAVLNLLSAAADEHPLLCLVDDAQWLDLASRQTLAFVARRLVAESVGLLIAVREPTDDTTFSGVEDLRLAGLDDEDSRRLLERVMTGPLDTAVRDRIIAETGGNPLALTELPRAVGPSEFAVGYGVSSAPGVSARVEDSFVRRVQALPESTRGILVVAALEPVGDPGLVLRAAESLDLTADALMPAVHDGLLDVGVTIRFRHPLIRSAVVRAAADDQLQTAHNALAEATDPDVDPDRRAWHRAEAIIGFDEDVAADLVRSARRAQARGGLVAAAAFHERAVELTPDPELRSRRALMAAEDKYRAGAMTEALALLEFADAAWLNDHQQARAELVRARVAHQITRGKDAPRLLLHTAARLQLHDPEASLSIYSDAFIAALSSGDKAVGKDIHDVALAILEAEAPRVSGAGPAAVREALHGLALLVTDGYRAAGPTLRAALEQLRSVIFRADESPAEVSPQPGTTTAGTDIGPTQHQLQRGLGADATAEEEPKWVALAVLVARILADDAAMDALTAEGVRLCRATGAQSLLPMAMAERLSVLLWSGKVAEAASLADAILPVIEATDTPRTLRRSLWLHCFRGDESEALQVIAQPHDDVLARGEGQWLISLAYCGAMLFNALGRYSDAFELTEHIPSHPFDIGLAAWLLSERVEAAVRSGHDGEAKASAGRLTEMADASETPWARGTAARALALLADGEAAEGLYLEAIDLLASTRMTVALARARLVYGEWLRRENRRVEAREQLRAAYDLLARTGVHGFAERARRELFATGETVHRRTADAVEGLTAQELQIAMLAAAGSTNPEIGAELYLSPRTVEWHLRKVFAKLGVTSRRRLADALHTAR